MADDRRAMIILITGLVCLFGGAVLVAVNQYRTRRSMYRVKRMLEAAMDGIRRRYGSGSIAFGTAKPEEDGALDSRTGREVLKFLKQLHQEGNTVVLITHDNSIAVKAERIVRRQDGKIIYDGDSRDPRAVVQPHGEDEAEEVGA